MKNALTALKDWTVLLPFSLLIGILILLTAAALSTGIGLNHDDGIYVTTGKAIAEGHGYSIDGYPKYLPQTKYPPVLPLLVAAVWKVFPKFPVNEFALKVIPLTGFVVWLCAIWMFLRKYVDEISDSMSLWLLVLLAVNQWALMVTSWIMSDALFGAFVMITLMLLGEIAMGRANWRTAVIAGLTAGLAYQTRTAAVSLILAGVLTLVLLKHFREAALFAVVSAIFVASWMIWQNQPVETSNAAEAYYNAANYRQWSLPTSGLPSQVITQIAGVTSIFIFTYPARSVLMAPRGLWILFGLSALFWIFLLRGLRKLPKQLWPATLFAMFSAGMLVLYAWMPDRLMYPILPVLLILFWRGLPRKATLVAVPLAMVLPLIAMVKSVEVTRANGTADIFVPSWMEDTASPKKDRLSVRPLFQVYDWVKQNTRRDEVILANFDPSLYLYTERKSIRPYAVDGFALFYDVKRPLENKLADFNQIIERYSPSYLAETAADPYVEPDFDFLIKQLREEGRIRLVQEFAPRYRIWEIVGAASISSQAAR